jgi:hypothetical protein
MRSLVVQKQVVSADQPLISRLERMPKDLKWRPQKLYCPDIGYLAASLATRRHMLLKVFHDTVPEKVMVSIQEFVSLSNAKGGEVSDELKSTWTESLEATRVLALLKDLSSVE